MRLGLAVVLLMCGCSRDFGLPVNRGAGSLTGTVSYSEPGRGQALPARGATLELLGTSVRTRALENGAFTLEPIATRTGAALFRFDADGDGAAEFQKLLRLEEVNAGPGRTVNVGTLLLGGNATIRGQVLRRAAVTASGGHAGTTVFIPEGPFSASTGDNGSFVMENLPEGKLTLSFFRPGFLTSTVNVEVRAREVLTLGTVLLDTAEPGATTRVIGRAVLSAGAPAEGVRVSTSSGQQVVTKADGAFEFASLERGIVSFGFEKQGYLSVARYNLAVDGATLDLGDVTLFSGQSVPPVLDAGLPPAFDAGFDAGVDAGFDAGVDAGFDAGVDAGFDAGADAGVDAGVDAGPVAVVDVGAPAYMSGTTVSLSGVRSQGVRPLSYQWQQIAGVGVVLSANGSLLAATPTFTAPNSFGVLRFTLTVTDALGRVSAPTVFTVTVGTVPFARIDAGFPTTLFAGQRIVIGGGLSVDTSGAGIIGYEWSASPDDAGLVLQPNGVLLQVAAPSVIASPSVTSIQLVVVNGLGLRSVPVNVPLILSPMAAPTWSLDAGRAQFVTGGEAATLSALAEAPSVLATYDYQWSPTTVDAGVAGSFSLVTPNAASSLFLAPIISGPNVVVPFSVTATVTSGGVTPAQRTAQTFVTIQDQRRPVLVGSSVESDLTIGPLGLWAEFDEDLAANAPTALNTSTPVGSVPQAPGSDSQGFWTPRRIGAVFTAPATETTAVQVNFNIVNDLSPQANQSIPRNVVARVASRWVAPHQSAPLAANASPALVMVPGFPPVAQVVSAGPGGLVAYAPVVVGQCDAGCVLTTESAPQIAVTAPAEGRRGWIVGGQPVVALQTRTADGGTPGLAMRRTSTGWQRMADPPGTLFSDGTALYSPFVDDGLKLSSYDFATNTWLTPEIISADAVRFAAGPTSLGLAWGQVGEDGSLIVVGRPANGLGLWSSIKAPTGSTWVTPFDRIGTAIPKDVRMVRDTFGGNVATLVYLTEAGALGAAIYGNVNNAWTLIPSGVTSFDTLGGKPWWVAAVVSGELRLYSQTIGTGQWRSFNGPLRNGMPSLSFNDDPMCEADKPELAKRFEVMVLTWRERCGAGPWRTMLRNIR
jgi:hypothetical protein